MLTGKNESRFGKIFKKFIFEYVFPWQLKMFEIKYFVARIQHFRKMKEIFFKSQSLGTLRKTKMKSPKPATFYNFLFLTFNFLRIWIVLSIYFLFKNLIIHFSIVWSFNSYLKLFIKFLRIFDKINEMMKIGSWQMYTIPCLYIKTKLLMTIPRVSIKTRRKSFELLQYGKKLFRF